MNKKNTAGLANFVSVSSSAVMMSQVSFRWPAAWKWHWIKVSGGQEGGGRQPCVCVCVCRVGFSRDASIMSPAYGADPVAKSFSSGGTL